MSSKDFLAGIDIRSAIAADLEAEFAAAADREMTPPPGGFDGLLAALGGHVPGYTEIASEGGVHWYQRDDDRA